MSEISEPAGGRRDGRATRERLLDAAIALFADQGMEGASTREVAQAAGVHPALVRHHFGDKLGLWRAAAGRALDTLRRAHAAARAELDEGRSLEALLRALPEHPSELRMLAGALLAAGEPRQWLLDGPVPELLAAARAHARAHAPARPLSDAELAAWLGAVLAGPLLAPLLASAARDTEPAALAAQLDGWLRGPAPAPAAGEWSIPAAHRRRLRSR